ncbi:uncharacterized protein LOC133785257 [Humulus lupulus]|uniref:uncharacterized protein LOC133785257 n=1 Tax=Humulus lupulus TaxID=3486 RepID=UPI002B4163AF|nr:uncharacterized protein LOC133785257 [Humulus lupulus]
MTFDHNHKDFVADPRNVRLGLASDGMNPFKTLRVSHSTWPIILIPYNLPPWMCMKQPNFIMSLLIPGPDAPGNNINVYLKPLIEELKELWEVGVETFDASTKKNFNMRASLLWTISDFPAYTNLSGWSTKGKYTCPSCHQDTYSLWLKYRKNHCYMGHRRWLENNDPFRNDEKSFDGTKEKRMAPTPLSGSIILDTLAGYQLKFGKTVVNPSLPYDWKKKSIFFDLPYWKDNLLRHNVDVMHIEKNVCESLIGTLLSLDAKNKDNLNARLDLKYMGIRSELHPKESESKKTVIPLASYETRIAGPSVYRCVYPIERYLSKLKSYVRNKSKPEGCIAEGYLADEWLTFCSRYMEGVETKFNCKPRNYSNVEPNGETLPIFQTTGRHLGKIDTKNLDEDTKVEELYDNGDDRVSEDLRCLANGPNNIFIQFKRYLINGFRFHTKEIEKNLRTQNSGVIMTAKTQSFASSRDPNPVFGEVTFYGILTDIIVLDYSLGNRVVLFKCDWISRSGIKKEKDCTRVNFSKLMREDEQFILASQAEQSYLQTEVCSATIDVGDGESSLVREEMQDIMIDTSVSSFDTNEIGEET